MDFGWDLQGNKETRAGMNVVYTELDNLMRDREAKKGQMRRWE